MSDNNSHPAPAPSSEDGLTIARTAGQTGLQSYFGEGSAFGSFGDGRTADGGPPTTPVFSPSAARPIPCRAAGLSSPSATLARSRRMI